MLFIIMNTITLIIYLIEMLYVILCVPNNEYIVALDQYDSKEGTLFRKRSRQIKRKLTQRQIPPLIKTNAKYKSINNRMKVPRGYPYRCSTGTCVGIQNSSPVSVTIATKLC
jgi:hypothetical protein